MCKIKINLNISKVMEIFLVFFKISPVTFGGGFAMVPLLDKEIVENKKWMDNKKLADILAASQSVPGAVGVNSAIFIGYHVYGVPGALAAMAGIIIPTFVIILVLASLFNSLQENTYMHAAMKGIRPVIIALIAIAAMKMGKVSLIDRISWVICLISTLILNVFTGLNILFVILSGAVAGILIVKVREKFTRGSKEV